MPEWWGGAGRWEDRKTGRWGDGVDEHSTVDEGPFYEWFGGFEPLVQLEEAGSWKVETKGLLG